MATSLLGLETSCLPVFQFSCVPVFQSSWEGGSATPYIPPYLPTVPRDAVLTYRSSSLHRSRSPTPSTSIISLPLSYFSHSAVLLYYSAILPFYVDRPASSSAILVLSFSFSYPFSYPFSYRSSSPVALVLLRFCILSFYRSTTWSRHLVY